jgi:hypothetical protein
MVFKYLTIQVTDARLKLENIGSEIKNIKDLVWGLVSVYLTQVIPYIFSDLFMLTACTSAGWEN